jgi:hypothetical protein
MLRDHPARDISIGIAVAWTAEKKSIEKIKARL